MRIAIIDESGLCATILEEGLREAGFQDIEVIPAIGAFVARLERMAPDVVLMNLGNPSRDSLEEMLAVSRALARPIAMFVDQSDDDMIGAAIDAGVSAYVVDGLRKDRVKPILDLAIRRFHAFAKLQAELDDARTELAERKTVDRAKAILIESRNLSEAEAYALLRTSAMNRAGLMDARASAGVRTRGRVARELLMRTILRCGRVRDRAAIGFGAAPARRCRRACPTADARGGA